ncbi:protein of unknown function [Acidithiobacillus ferrivorans]|uniref:Uncharacterized protein n=1 Tax=Acidithiobacillus ferrivorans TaxID=160808 RepID=A0ABY1MR65_9PROT|nr:protein of unknown function [Acidithiobacillus ferrivorans]
MPSPVCATSASSAAPAIASTTTGKLCASCSRAWPRAIALPALGGLFVASQCPALDTASLDNAHLLGLHATPALVQPQRQPGPGGLPQYGFRRTGQRLRKPAGTGARH